MVIELLPSVPSCFHREAFHAVADRFQARFNDAMGQMMSDQMNSEFWRNRLPPVTDILFEKDGVKDIRKAPEVRDSRFS
jgi:hypothetical protein